MDGGTMMYAVLKYTPDLFRQEPRNIGVFVVDEVRALMRAVGINADGVVDLRMARRIHGLQDDSSHLAEWLAHWQRLVEYYSSVDCYRDPFRLKERARLFLEGIVVEAEDGTFTVAHGGIYVPEHDTMTLEEVAAELYRDLVAVPDDTEEIARKERPSTLYREVRETFTRLGLLAPKSQPDDAFRHFIKKDEPVPGTLGVPHRPKYSQLNGKLTVMEQLDFRLQGEEKITHHALSTAYMFDDIRQGNSLAPLELIVIVHWSPDRNTYAQQVGRAALSDVPGTRFVNWSDSGAVQRFLRDRRQAAGLPA